MDHPLGWWLPLLSTESSDWWRQIQRSIVKHWDKHHRESCWEKTGGIVGVSWPRDIIEKPEVKGSWELTESKPTISEPAWDWPRSSAYVTVAYLGLFVGHLAKGTGAVPCDLTVFWKHIPHAILPCPVWTQGEVLGLMEDWYAMPCWYSWEACSFLSGRGEDW